MNFTRAFRTLVIFLNLGLFSASVSGLFGATVTNEGETPVKVLKKTKSGFPGTFELDAGKTVTLPRDILSIAHVPEGKIDEVKLTIIADNGEKGLIGKPGGEHSFIAPPKPAKTVEKKQEGPPPLKPGSAVNKSDIEFNVTLTGRNKIHRTYHLMPGQTAVIPEDTIEVRAEKSFVSPLPARYNLLILMPDGKKYEVKKEKKIIRLGEQVKK